MKNLIFALGGLFLLSFSKHDNIQIDGIWIGHYRSNFVKEKVVVKFDQKSKLEFYSGGVDERTRCNSSYEMIGDSVFFKYTSPEGEVFTMKGALNSRRNMLDGSWNSSEENSGLFFLEKQRFVEMHAQP